MNLAQSVTAKKITQNWRETYIKLSFFTVTASPFQHWWMFMFQNIKIGGASLTIVLIKMWLAWPNIKKYGRVCISVTACMHVKSTCAHNASLSIQL